MTAAAAASGPAGGAEQPRSLVLVVDAEAALSDRTPTR